MKEGKGMIGYKAFNNDWTCRGFQYKIGETYRMDEVPKCCMEGFHFCKKMTDCFSYYRFSQDNKYALVESRGAVVTNDGKKFATNVLRIIKEISWAEVLNLVNTGEGNTGLDNTGEYNKGDWNAGSYNTGNRNTGHYNIGNYNTGAYNSGSYNSGDWNSGWFNSGCFNTKDGAFFMFNKPSSWTYLMWYDSTARFILNQCPKNIGERQKWYDSLREPQKEIIKLLPNFDAKIFKQITGINV